jgi:hypothetical protein
MSSKAKPDFRFYLSCDIDQQVIEQDAAAE